MAKNLEQQPKKKGKKRERGERKKRGKQTVKQGRMNQSQCGENLGIFLNNLKEPKNEAKKKKIIKMKKEIKNDKSLNNLKRNSWKLSNGSKRPIIGPRTPPSPLPVPRLLQTSQKNRETSLTIQNHDSLPPPHPPRMRTVTIFQ